MSQLRSRLAREERGFTTLELLIVVIILAILLAIAMPAYLSERDNANKTAAAANLRSAATAISLYYQDNFPRAPAATDPDYATSNSDTGFAGLTFAELQAHYDGTLDPSKFWWDNGWTPASPATTATDFCVYTLVGVWYAAKHGLAGQVTEGRTMTLATCTAS